MPEEQHRRRRLDRVLADNYLDGVSERSADEIRRMRDGCQVEENDISFTRRCLHAKLDVIRAEVDRRRAGADDPGSVRPLLDALPAILSDEQAVRRPMRFRSTRVVVPPSVQHARRRLERFTDRLVLSDVTERPTEELSRLIEQTAAHERELSMLRRELHAVIDQLQDELAARYESGRTTVSNLFDFRG